MQEWTTFLDVVSDNETTFMENNQEAVIIGSCGIFFIIAICFCIMFKLKNHRTTRNLEANEIQQSAYVDNLSMNVHTRSANYKSLQLDGNFDSDIYENTGIDSYA